MRVQLLPQYVQYVHYYWTYCQIIGILTDVITVLDIRDRVRADVLDYLQLVSCLRGYLRDKSSLELRSREFFLQITEKIQTV